MVAPWNAGEASAQKDLATSGAEGSHLEEHQFYTLPTSGESKLDILLSLGN